MNDDDRAAWSPEQMRPARDVPRQTQARPVWESGARFLWLLFQTIGFGALIAQDAGHRQPWHTVTLLAVPISWVFAAVCAVAWWQRRRRTC